MLEQVDLTQVLFLDIETVSGKADFSTLSEDLQALWAIKAKTLHKGSEPLDEEITAALYTERAAIYAEFGKIICISVGIMYRDKNTQQLQIRLKSFASHNETELLHEFSQLLLQFYNNPKAHFLCGHNIKEFDIPYICRRMVVNQLPFPALLQIAGKKPWEISYMIDTLELWKFGDIKAYTSLKLLAAVLGFPSPKDDIDGSQVGRVYWQENDLPRISHYCEKDVLATAQLLLRYKRMPILETDQVIHVA